MKYPLDRESVRLSDNYAPEGCDHHTAERAFALLCFAAANCAARLSDEREFDLDSDLRTDWGIVCHLLFELAHWASPDTGDPGTTKSDDFDIVKLVLEEGRKRA